ncbi:MAG TPA: prolyl oligopeptidase family serine peptidase [Rhizomicrobium sp.]
MRNIFVAVLFLTALTGFAAMADESDPYVWLEDVHGAKPLAWVAEQNARSLGLLKADPRYQANYDSILSVLDAPDRIAYGGLDHGFVYNFWQDAAHPKGIWRRTTIADYANAVPHWQLLLDVDALAAKEKENWVWKGAECSPDQAHCLIRLSRGGGDAVVVREYDLKAMALTADGFALKEAKTDASYLDDNTILFASDFGPGSMTTSGYARIVKLWKRGTPIADARTVFEGKREDVLSAPMVFHTGQGDFAFAVRAVSFFQNEYYAITPDGAARKLDLPLGADVKGMIDGALIATLREDWNTGAKTYPKGALIAWRETAPTQILYAPGPRQSIEDVSVGRDALYAAITDNVIGSIHAFRIDGQGWTDNELDLPGGGTTAIVATDDYGPEAMFRFESYLTPTTLYADSGEGKPHPIKSLPARFDASGLVTEQFFATSADGTQIPYFVTRPKNLSGPAPTILYGYGGFEISLTPSYSANFGRLWLSRGGIYVVANIRGGGEFGPAWHDAALQQNRQKAFDDFAAVARDLIARGLTIPARLGIMGGSNGGLLVSTVMVQHPELLGAVVCQVPLIDMLAYTHIGAGASWIGEYGDPAIPAQREYILKYSPYQNVKAGVHYPPVFFVTATSDDRVSPVHARKMAAKMEAQGHDVLFYENTDGGHAAAADHKQAAEMWALSFVYLAEKLGLK